MKQMTLGGERLGSGKKMKIDLHGYERSTHNLSTILRTTMSAGTLVPFMSKVGLPGDTWDINLKLDVKTHPTIGPLFGSFKAQADLFLIPIRLYQGQLHNNKLGIGRKMSNVKLPIMELPTPILESMVPEIKDLDNASINPSCIFNYLGIRGTGIEPSIPPDVQTRIFNACSWLGYWDTVKNYYANKQEEKGIVIHTPAVGSNSPDLLEKVGGATIPEEGLPGTPQLFKNGDKIEISYTGVPPILSEVMINTDKGRISIEDIRLGAVDGTTPGILIVTFDGARYGEIVISSWAMRRPWELRNNEPETVEFDLENIDIMRERILAHSVNSDPFNINDQDLDPYRYITNDPLAAQNLLASQEGLACKTYQSDLFNNWLNSEWIDGPDGVNTISAVSTLSGSFTIDQLNLSKKVYDLHNRVAVSDGTYDQWLDAVYMTERITRAETPMYMGGLIRELAFQEVISNSDAGGQPLGTLAGQGVMTDKVKGGNVIIKVDEHSYILGIVSLTPRVDYSQGNQWDVHLQTMDDFHKPALDQIGFQELSTEQMAWWDTHREDDVWTINSAGKQPAWINYMTDVNVTKGNFAIQENEMFMTLNRRYEHGPDGHITDLTTYIDPKKFNFIFAQTSRDAQNFWVQIGMDIQCRRIMSAKVMPQV